MKYFYLVLVMVIGSINAKAQESLQWITFNWHGETIFGKYYPKVAMSIPLKIENLPYHFCGQLDLGATTTLIYENSFRAVMQKQPEIARKLDTAIAPYYLNGRKCHFLKALHLQLDNTPYPNRNVALVPDYGDTVPADSINSPSEKLIGTIAPDLFQGKILIIDFSKNKLTTVDQLPEQFAKARFVPAVIKKGRVKVPLKIGDSTCYVMFDTGNCLGDLLLDKVSINQFTDARELPLEFLNGNTWGQSVAYYSKPLTKKIYLDNQQLSISHAQFSDQDSDVQFNKEEKIIGLIGPVLFADKVIIIDYKTSRFGML